MWKNVGWTVRSAGDNKGRNAIRKKTSGKGGTEKAKTGRKLADLKPKRVKKDAAIKGGALNAYLWFTGSQSK